MPRKSKKNILSRFFGIGSSTQRQEEEDAEHQTAFDPEQYIEEGTRRAIDISSAPGVFSPALTEAELLAIRLPGGMVAESYVRNRDFERAVARVQEMMPAIQVFIEECKLKIAEAEDQGINTDIYRKRKGGRGEAKLLTKVERGQRVTLNWNDFGVPVGPGSWGTRFNEAIGCLVRRTDVWDVAFTFRKHGHAAFRDTWLELLQYFVLEGDDMDDHWEYVRRKMGEKYKKAREKLKRKYIKNPKYEEDWQRFCGMPSNVSQESFAYLLLHWGSKYAQDESVRNAENRMRNPDHYYGGSVKESQYRTYVDTAGGDASLATTWQVLYTKPDMPEDQLATQRENWEGLATLEREYREANPDFPATQTILPPNVEAGMLEIRFPNSAGKGYYPMLGQATPSRRSTSTSTSRSGGYTQQIQDLQDTIQKRDEELQREREERAKKDEERARRDEEITREQREMREQIAMLMQRPQPPQGFFDDPGSFQEYYAFLRRRQQDGADGSSGGG